MVQYSMLPEPSLGAHTHVLISKPAATFTISRARWLFISEHLRRQDGGGFHLFDVRDRLAYGNLSTLDCIFRIRLRPDPSACHRELDVDRDAVSPVDDIGQRAYSRSAEKVDRLISSP